MRLISSLFVLLSTFTILTIPSVAESQCMTVCSPTAVGSGMTCMVTAQVPCPASYPDPLGTNIYATGMSANCNPTGKLKALASHPSGFGPNAGTQASCSFIFVQQCVDLACGGGCFDTKVTKTCVVSASDGLPVELLEFSVDED